MSLKKLYLELTNRCNLECSICYRRSWNEKLQDMDIDLYRKVRNEAFESESMKTVVLGGIGEPTCSPLIGNALEDFARYDLTLTTNAVYLEQNLLNSIVKYAKLVMISIDGLYENFSKIRGAKLESVLENISRINDLKKKYGKNTPYIGIQFVISRDNIEDIFKLIDLANCLNVHILVLSNLLPQTGENAGKILYTRYENKEMKLLYKKILSYSNRKGVNIHFPNYELKTERRCSFIEEDAMFISVSGEAVPCYRLSHSYKEFVFGREKTVLIHSFGNAKDKSLKEIWESKEYESFRNMVGNNKYPSCIDCDLVEGCDMVKDTSTDCYAGSPSCADCLWSRKITICP